MVHVIITEDKRKEEELMGDLGGIARLTIISKFVKEITGYDIRFISIGGLDGYLNKQIFFAAYLDGEKIFEGTFYECQNRLIDQVDEYYNPPEPVD